MPLKFNLKHIAGIQELTQGFSVRNAALGNGYGRNSWRSMSGLKCLCKSTTEFLIMSCSLSHSLAATQGISATRPGQEEKSVVFKAGHTTRCAL